MSKIVGLDTFDVRFPTSRTHDGSDAMNRNPDYASAYVIVRTDAPDGLAGHGFVFTIGRGNEVQLAAIRALEPFLAGRDVDELLDDLGGLSRELVGDSHLRWLGPERGVMHMAIGAVLNACWDMAARRAGKPLWRLLAELTPQQIVDLVDFRYLADVITPQEALALLEHASEGRAERIATLERDGYPAYTTAPGWLGYDDARLEKLCAEAVDAGFELVKIKVGASIEDDLRRCAIARASVGERIGIALDANQVWDVPTAISWIAALARFDPAWIEEPTSPDDILGTAAIRSAIQPVRVAVGEHVANRVIFKQLLQAQAIDIVQIDACRVAGVNENLANLLLAAKFGVPVCPHAGGVGLCELVQHLAMFDYVALSGTTEDRRIEWIDHLHEHFVAPAVVVDGRYRAPSTAGASTEMQYDSLMEFAFPGGAAWLAERVQRADEPRAGAGRTRGPRYGRRASGIGLAAAQALRALGARVAVLDQVDVAEPGLISVRADVSDDAAARRAVAEAIDAFGGLDILVNNVGIEAQGTVEENPDEEWHHVFDVNVLSIVRVSRCDAGCAAQLAGTPRLSTPARSPRPRAPRRALYGATKGAVLSLTLAMAADHLREGIRVNCVNPGTTDTPWIGRLLDATDTTPRPSARR